MKKILVSLLLFSSLAALSNTSLDRYTETKTLMEVLNYIQQNYSFQCGMKIKSKRKMFFNCTSSNAMTFIKIKTKPGKSELGERVEKVTINFLNSEDGKYTIADTLSGLQESFSYVCGAEKMKFMRNGKIKSKWNCNVKELGDLIVELKMNPSASGSAGWEELSVTFTK